MEWNFGFFLSTPSVLILLQSDPNQNLLIQMAINLKIGISDPVLIKP